MGAYSQDQPYISFVATSRNDNHGGDLTNRMQIFVKALIYQCNKFQLHAELLMVEWNPPADAPLLNQILPTPKDSDFLRIRYVQVPPVLHKSLKFSDTLPLFQMIAKNVGIRRSNAPFVVCTNIDLLFEDALIEKLAQQDLKEGCYYRANRCDIPNKINLEMPVENMLAFARENMTNRLGKSAFYPNLVNTTSFLFRFWMMIPLFWLASQLKYKLYSSIRNKLDAMDTEACGDFTMMSKKDWLRIGGYPEFEIYSLHIDSMGLIAANAIDLKQVIFSYKACTYHLAHSKGWEFQNATERLLFFTNKPVLEWWSVHKWSLEVLKSGKDFNFNGEDWGLAQQQLEEINPKYSLK